MFDKILVALDGSDHAQKALDTAVQLAQRCDGELVLFHAVQLSALRGDYHAMVTPAARKIYRGLGREQGEAILDSAEKTAREMGMEKVVRLIVESDSTAKAILSAADSAGASLLVVGTRGLTGLRELTMGSVAHKVTAAANCPVLSVR